MTLHMTPQDHVLDAVLRAQGILADYIEPGPHDCEQTLARLFGILNDEKLMRAVNALNLKAADELAARSPAA
ncbi:hypothetical protein [Bradyrhizobium sp. G127]|jgi:hypothetical protein|uniref:hypothetical protein n=1 Tax=Bradyrhizobium sp. G127 TaxID=2904800 RepID=UPI001F348D55|nr:hypothetical protein [Bradyrhizobium sp. G127]MCF2523002.1 hypothetical protein [Bradyrhizobium sp. G127]